MHLICWNISWSLRKARGFSPGAAPAKERYTNHFKWGNHAAKCKIKMKGVSIISKKIVFHKGLYLRLEFFISRVNLVFYKKKYVVFYKILPLLIKIANFANFSIFGKGKKWF